MGIFNKKQKRDPFNPFGDGVSNNFSSSGSVPTPPPTNMPSTMGITPSETSFSPTPAFPEANPVVQTEPMQTFPAPDSLAAASFQTAVAPIDNANFPNPAQATGIKTNPLLETTGINTPATIEVPIELNNPSAPLPQVQYGAETPTLSPTPMEITEPTLPEQQPLVAEAQANTNNFTVPAPIPVETQPIEPTMPEIAPSYAEQIIPETTPPYPEPVNPETTPPYPEPVNTETTTELPSIENTDSEPSPLDALIANSQSGLEITDRPANNFFRKNLIPLIIISVVVIALSVLSLLFYIKWQGEKADNLEKASAINNLTSQLQSAENDNDDDASSASKLDELNEEIKTLTTDKLKLEENNKTLTDKNSTLQKQNDELNKQVKTTACEAMTDAAEKQTCLSSIDESTTQVE